MRGGFLIVLSFFIWGSLSAQRQYKLPKGILHDQIDQNWVLVKSSNLDAIKNRSSKVKTLRKSIDGKPSILDGLFKVKVPSGMDPVDFIQELLKDENVIYADPIVGYKPLYEPSDPQNSSNQGYLEQISAYDAWGVTRGDDDLTIGIVDTGLDLDHEDLVNSIWVNENDPVDGVDNDGNGYVDDYYGYDFADGDSDPNADGSTHGVRVGGIAGATTDNAIGISGVGFNTKIAALKGFRTEGTISNNLFEAITYAADNGISILNLSFGSLRDGLQSEQDIIDYAVLEKDVVITAAAGNTDVDGKFHPASYEHVLSVGATDGSDNRWSLSTYNYAVDIMAPGTSIYSTIGDNNYGSDFGTSYASPMVAGAASLVKTVFPELNALQVMERIRVSADDIYDVGSNSSFDGKLGLGRLNAFRAVSQENLKSIRAANASFRSSRDDAIFYGDTVLVSFDITNYLDVVDDPEITITSPNGDFSTEESVLSPGSLSTLEESAVDLQFIINNDVAPESDIAIRLDFNDGAYADFQFLEFRIQGDYFDFGTELVGTIAGNGNLGFEDTNYTNGAGLVYKQNPILRYAGLMIADSESAVSDNIIFDYGADTRDQDFTTTTFYRNKYHPAADQFGFSEFEDNLRDLVVEQSAFAWKTEDFIVIRYRLINNSASAMTNLNVGLFTDFDLDEANTNRSEYDVAGQYMFTNDFNETIFAGTKIIGSGSAAYSCLDMSDQNGNTADIDQVFTNEAMYDFLTNQFITSAGDLGDGNDVAQLNGIAISQIDPFESETVTVIIAAASSQSELENVFTQAETRIDEAVENPEILETTFSCEGSQVTLNPSAGTNYKFYEDALGTIEIHEGESFLTGIISSDTTFYVSNLDGAYPSSIFQYRVNLIDEVADFSMSPDTLYLDDGNTVTFTDESFNAISWDWDFGEGTTTAIQHPMLSFSATGNYDIALTIENENGCIDTKTKTLVVANRPSSPSFDLPEICPGSSVTLSDPAADKLLVYLNENAINPSYEGNDLVVGPFQSSTTVYVEGIYSQLKSPRVPIQIDVEVIPVEIIIEIDTTSSTHRLRAFAETSETNLQWTVDGQDAGTSSEIFIDSSAETIDINLAIESNSGCTVGRNTSFNFSSSPIPSQSDVNVCQGESGFIRPQNGEIFGFYEDEDLNNLIKKGTELELNGQTKLFIVGLDDGLPSIPREVNITYDDFSANIEYVSEPVANQTLVTFTAASQVTTTGYQWYVNDELVTEAESPKLVLTNSTHTIVLLSTNELGCTASDTLSLDLTPPLSFEDDPSNYLFPNPATRQLNVSAEIDPIHISVWDLAGKSSIIDYDPDKTLDVSGLSPGVYLFKITTNEQVIEQKILINQE